jgi:hypothetical protein
LAGKFVVPVGFVIDRGHRLANQCSAVLRTSAFTVRAHCALALPITASGAIASSTIHQNCRSMLGYAATSDAASFARAVPSVTKYNSWQS